MRRRMTALEVMARRSDPELLRDSQRFEQAKRVEGLAKRVAQESQSLIIGELEQRRVRRVQLEDTLISVVQETATHYDAPGLFKDLNGAQRRRVFREEINLNALPEEWRAKVIAGLPKSVRFAVTRHVLDDAALERELAARSIRPERATRHLRTSSKKPYIRISHGPGK